MLTKGPMAFAIELITTWRPKKNRNQKKSIFCHTTYTIVHLTLLEPTYFEYFHYPQKACDIQTIRPPKKYKLYIKLKTMSRVQKWRQFQLNGFCIKVIEIFLTKALGTGLFFMIHTDEPIGQVCSGFLIKYQLKMYVSFQNIQYILSFSQA